MADGTVTDRHLILAGCGHAHLDLLAALCRGIPAGWRVTLVTPQPAFHYSGMLPSIIARHEPPAAADVLVARIAAAAGMSVALARVTALDASARRLTLDDGRTLSFDLLSLDVGSVAAGLDLPGARAHAFAVRPFATALALVARLDARAAEVGPGGAVPVVVVGGGAGGVEVAFAIRARLAASGCLPDVTIIESSCDDGLPLAGFAPAQRRGAARALALRGIAVVAARVTAAAADHVSVTPAGGAGDRVLPSQATAWVTGAAPHPWLAASGLACDDRGFPLAAPTLALDDVAMIFGGGDTVTLRDAPRTAKAGVYAVRMAPVLAANVLAAMTGTALRRVYAPQQDFLALLSTSDGRALLNWRGRALESRWAQQLKSWIDERYLARYRALPATAGR